MSTKNGVFYTGVGRSQLLEEIDRLKKENERLKTENIQEITDLTSRLNIAMWATLPAVRK